MEKLGFDDVDNKATVCCKEGCGEGASKDVIAWGLWDNSDQ